MKKPIQSTFLAVIRSSTVWQEILGLLFVLIAGLIFLSLISFSPNDSTMFSSSPNVTTHNLAGGIGVKVASLLFAGFGFSAYFIAGLLLWAGIHQTLHGSLRGSLGIVGGILAAMLVFGALFDRVLMSSETYFRGGAVGNAISLSSQSLLGGIGSYALFGFLLLADAIFMFKFSFKDYITRFAGSIKNAAEKTLTARREAQNTETSGEMPEEAAVPVQKPPLRMKSGKLPPIPGVAPLLRKREVGALGLRVLPLVEKVTVRNVVMKRKPAAEFGVSAAAKGPIMEMIPPFDRDIYGDEEVRGTVSMPAASAVSIAPAAVTADPFPILEKPVTESVQTAPAAAIMEVTGTVDEEDLIEDAAEPVVELEETEAASADSDEDQTDDNDIDEADEVIEETDAEPIAAKAETPVDDDENNILINEVKARIQEQPGDRDGRVDTLPERHIVPKKVKESDVMPSLIQDNYDPRVVDKKYKGPSIDLLKRSIVINDGTAGENIKATAVRLEQTLADFDVVARVVGASRGPVITRYELELEAGTRVSKVANLTDNIALALASESVRIIAPIPGRSVIGIEIPNKVRTAVLLRDVLESEDFRSSKADIPFVLGKGIYGNNVVGDLAAAPHLLVAGTTGSGKSVCLSTVILSLLYRFRPDELKFIFIDKKRVELSIYNGIPHLMAPVVSDEKKATVVLRHIVDIMEKRYEKMEKFYVRSVKAYNEKVKSLIESGEKDFEGEPLEFFPYMVVVIDELHNLMIVASKEVEDLISRLAGMSRAVGIHLIIATQRPSADVVTGVIKANLPTRIAFQVPNKMNSRIIIDMGGAEQLLGKGDSLFCSPAVQMPERVQGAFVSDTEVKKVVDEISNQLAPMYDEEVIAMLEAKEGDDSIEEDAIDDSLWEDAVALVVRTRKASASFLQRRLKIGYNRAARIVEIMEQRGIIGPENGSKPREVLLADKGDKTA
ncbi:MAG: DNA translocase FtsK [Spirochaetes bacterium]|nr:DNA translocase FtsK [Spirochaetota bacterium]